jgi:DNA-binding phage protein
MSREYLSQILADGDTNEVIAKITKARGMSQTVKDTYFQK